MSDHFAALCAENAINDRITYFMNNPNLDNDLSAKEKKDVLGTIRGCATTIQEERDHQDLPEGFGWAVPLSARWTNETSSLFRIIEEMIKKAHAPEILRMQEVLKDVK